MDSTYTDYGLADAFFDTEPKSPSFEFMINAELKKNLYLNDKSMYRVYMYHFFFGFMTMVAETTNADSKFGFESISAKRIVATVDGRNTMTAGLKVAYQMKVKGQKQLFIKTILLDEHESMRQPLGLVEHEFDELKEILSDRGQNIDEYKFFIDEYIIRRVTNRYTNEGRGDDLVQIVVEKCQSPKQRPKIFPKLKHVQSEQTEFVDIGW